MAGTRPATRASTRTSTRDATGGKAGGASYEFAMTVGDQSGTVYGFGGSTGGSIDPTTIDTDKTLSVVYAWSGLEIQVRCAGSLRPYNATTIELAVEGAPETYTLTWNGTRFLDSNTANATALAGYLASQVASTIGVNITPLT